MKPLRVIFSVQRCAESVPRSCVPLPTTAAPWVDEAMERFIHRENIALYKKRLAEPHTETERAVLLKLLAEEEANAPRPKERQ
jgi:hypothetical protein